jgi:hypothetical protein
MAEVTINRGALTAWCQNTQSFMTIDVDTSNVVINIKNIIFNVGARCSFCSKCACKTMLDCGHFTCVACRQRLEMASSNTIYCGMCAKVLQRRFTDAKF